MRNGQAARLPTKIYAVMASVTAATFVTLVQAYGIIFSTADRFAA